MCWIEDVRGIHRPYTDLPEIFASIVGRKSRIGLIGKNILPVEIYEQIGDAVPDATFESRDDVMLDLRKIKSAAEIDLMERAADINDVVLKEAAKLVKVGMTEIQVAGLAENIARQMNADIGSATVVMSGPNTNYPAWRATDRKIQPGEYVMLDFNPAIGNYSDDSPGHHSSLNFRHSAGRAGAARLRKKLHSLCKGFAWGRACGWPRRGRVAELELGQRFRAGGRHDTCGQT